MYIIKGRGRQVKNMSIIGYYDGTSVHVEHPLRKNQKVIVIPIESETDMEESAAGGLHQYADVSLIEKEKSAWRKAAIEKHVEE